MISASNPSWATFSRSRAKSRTRSPRGCGVTLAKCEAIFRLQEPKKRMRDQAAHACRALCRARVAEELQRRRGTRIGEHLKLVLSIIRPAGALNWSRIMFAVVVVLLNALSFASLAYTPALSSMSIYVLMADVANRKGQHAMAALLAGEHGCLA